MTVELDEQGRAVRPRAHADAAFLAAKRARINEAHAAPLNALVRVWRQPANVADPFAAPVERAVPWFDPDGGGTGARVLILLEALGPKSVERLGSGIISLDNDDPTDGAVHTANKVTGLSRGDSFKVRATISEHFQNREGWPNPASRLRQSQRRRPA